jgi:hypothetical protein
MKESDQVLTDGCKNSWICRAGPEALGGREKRGEEGEGLRISVLRIFTCGPRAKPHLAVGYHVALGVVDIHGKRAGVLLFPSDPLWKTKFAYAL